MSAQDADYGRILAAWEGITIEAWCSCQDPRVPDHEGNQCGAGAHCLGEGDLALLALAALNDGSGADR